MQITVNGDARQVPEGMTLQGLIENLGLVEARVAVERNREVVTRANYPLTSLVDGDRLEIVTFVGGG